MASSSSSTSKRGDPEGPYTPTDSHRKFERIRFDTTLLGPDLLADRNTELWLVQLPKSANLHDLHGTTVTLPAPDTDASVPLHPAKGRSRYELRSAPAVEREQYVALSSQKGKDTLARAKPFSRKLTIVDSIEIPEDQHASRWYKDSHPNMDKIRFVHTPIGVAEDPDLHYEAKKQVAALIRSAALQAKSALLSASTSASASSADKKSSSDKKSTSSSSSDSASSESKHKSSSKSKGADAEEPESSKKAKRDEADSADEGGESKKHKKHSKSSKESDKDREDKKEKRKSEKGKEKEKEKEKDKEKDKEKRKSKSSSEK